MALIATAAFNVTLSSKNDLSAISLANIEVLATAEDTPGGETWQEATKTVVSIPADWSFSVALNLWFFKTEVKNTRPTHSESITFKCCRPKGELTKCVFEPC